MIFPGSMVQNLYLNPTVATSFRILYSRCQKFPYLSKYKYQQSKLLFIKMFSVHPKWTLRIEQPRGPSSSPPWRPPPSRRASPQPCTPRTTASPASPSVDADEDHPQRMGMI